MKTRMESSKEFKLIGKWSDEQQNYGKNGESVAVFDIEEAIDRIEKNTPGTIELEYELSTALTELIETDIEPRGLGEIKKSVACISICFVYSRAIVYCRSKLHFKEFN